MKNIASAFLKAQKKIENALKDGKNPHFKSKYATLESVLDTVKPIANENNIAIVQTINRDALGDYVQTLLIHTESGEALESKHYLHLDRPTMQALGSAITYSRRYSLVSMFGIGQEDDDGNAATASAPKEIKKQVASKEVTFDNYKNDKTKLVKFLKLQVARTENAKEVIVKLKSEFKFNGTIDELPLETLLKIAAYMQLSYKSDTIYSHELEG